MLVGWAKEGFKAESVLICVPVESMICVHVHGVYGLSRGLVSTCWVMYTPVNLPAVKSPEKCSIKILNE